MNIHHATSEDALLLSTLCMDVQRLHAGSYPEIFKMPQGNDITVTFFDEILADPLVRIFIADEDGVRLAMFCAN